MQRGLVRWIPIVLAIDASLAACAALAAAPLPACNGPAMKIVHYETVHVADAQLPAGDVIVEFTVDASGRVADPRILNSSDERLESYALESAVLWRYVAPARECRHRMQVLF